MANKTNKGKSKNESIKCGLCCKNVKDKEDEAKEDATTGSIDIVWA
jgi:hypothetical protein